MAIDFTPSQRSSLGIEVELELVDRGTRELRGAATEILTEMAGGNPEGHPKAKHELLESTVEIITGVCTSVAEARDDLSQTLAEVQARAAARDLRVMCSGTHPFTDWATQTISPNPRYARLIEDMQQMARQLQIFGIHVHVGVRSGDKAIPMVNALLAYIPHFLALSASSPYWMGRDTGLASSRSKVFEQLPTAGLPYQLSGWNEFERFMATLISAHTIRSIREVWWDIRPHPNFGTVELRICDGMPTLREVATIAAISQCLVEQFNTQIDRGYTLPVPRGWIVRENKWRAARYGVDAHIIADEAGTVRPLREAIEELVDDLTPVARRLGCEAELIGAHDILRVGPSYARQRRVVERGGTLRDVVDALAEEMETDTPIAETASREVPSSRAG